MSGIVLGANVGVLRHPAWRWIPKEKPWPPPVWN